MMPEPISVKPHPFRQTFDSVEAAVTHAFSHPMCLNAKRDAERLAGSTLVDGYWTLSEWGLHFSNGLCLRIWVPETEVYWQLSQELAQPADESVWRIGSPPIRLRWPEPHGVVEMDGSALLAKRRGAALQNLHVNHTGLYLYFRGHLVFEFHAAYRADGGGNIVYVREDE